MLCSFLLANCNAHSVLFVGAFLLFWLVDIANDDGVRRSRALRTFLLNSAIAALGVAICLLTIYPPFNDKEENRVSADVALPGPDASHGDDILLLKGALFSLDDGLGPTARCLPCCVWRGSAFLCSSISSM